MSTLLFTNFPMLMKICGQVGSRVKYSKITQFRELSHFCPYAFDSLEVVGLFQDKQKLI